MKEGLVVQRCQSCRSVYFPHRLLCPKCGGEDLGKEIAFEGIVEETTMVRQARGRADWVPHPIGTVRLPEGHAIIAGLDEWFDRGTRISLFDLNGAPYACEEGQAPKNKS